MDEEEAVWGNQEGSIEQWLVKEAQVVTPYAGIAALPQQSTAQLRLPYFLFPVSSITWASLLGGPYQVTKVFSLF